MNRRLADRRPQRTILNLRDVQDPYRVEVEAAALRAIAAGARVPLTFVGMGMTGTVFTDRSKNLAYKVARHPTSDMVAEEAEWFRDARRVPAMRDLIPGKVRWDAQNRVLIRRYVRGRPGSWGDATKLYDIHGKIQETMLPHGWTAPERKEDSYVVSGGSEGRDSWRAGDFTKATLIDASMPHRVGKGLVKYALDVAAGRRPHDDVWGRRLEDIAYYVYRERIAPNNHRGTIPVEDVRRVLAALRDAGGEFEWSV